MLTTKKLSTIFIILVIVTPTITQVQISAEALEVINDYYRSVNSSETENNFSQTDSSVPNPEFDYSILRKHMFTYLYDSTTSLENRYYMSLVYSQIFVDDKRDMVLALMAHELSIIYEAEVFVFLNTFLVYYQSDWCILLMHGDQEEDRNELIEYIDNLSTAFDIVILASCNSQYLALENSNVIGFDGVISFSTALETIGQEISYKNELLVLMDSELAQYELEVYPSGFVATSMPVMIALLETSMLNKEIYGINVVYPIYISLEEGSVEEKWGAEHINIKSESRYFFNDHILEILTSEDTITFRYPYTNPDKFGVIAVKKNPQGGTFEGTTRYYKASYVLIAPHPYTNTHHTIITGGILIGRRTENPENVPSNIIIKDLERHYEKKPIPIVVTATAACMSATEQLSSVIGEYLTNYGSYVDNKANGIHQKIWHHILLGETSQWIWDTILEPILSDLGTFLFTVVIVTLIIILSAETFLALFVPPLWGTIPCMIALIALLYQALASRGPALSYDSVGGEDMDNDGINDSLESHYYNLYIVGTPDEPLFDEYRWLEPFVDYEGDGFITWYEILAETDPFLDDTDMDGILDKDDQDSFKYEFRDEDNDGISNILELIYYESYIKGTDLEATYSGEDTWMVPSANLDNDDFTNLEEVFIGSNPFSADTDEDGLDDNEEVEIDYNLDEIVFHSDPSLRDTDGDGLGDGDELEVGSDPLNPDSDNDGLIDGWEIYTNQIGWYDETIQDNRTIGFEYVSIEDPATTEWVSIDSDGDGLNYSMESYYFTNPFSVDTDGDLLTDAWEIENGFDPTAPIDGLQDHDNDGIPTGWEVYNGFNPFDVSDGVEDPDGDLLNNLGEYTYSTNPFLSDTDSDNLDDWEETQVYYTNPNSSDSDGDGLPDGWEISKNFNPLVHDSSEDADGDGLTNFEEYYIGTNPLNSDTDSDGMNDCEEIVYGTNPFVHDANFDPDNDDLTNLEEVTIYFTNPFNEDTDGDGWSDYWEIHGIGPLNPSDPNDPNSVPSTSGGGGFFP